MDMDKSYFPCLEKIKLTRIWWQYNKKLFKGKCKPNLYFDFKTKNGIKKLKIKLKKLMRGQ